MIPTAHSKVQLSISHKDPEILQMLLSDPFLAKFISWSSEQEADIQVKVGKQCYSLHSQNVDSLDTVESHDSTTIHPLLSGMVDNPKENTFN